jgi:hypothetical protein
MVELRISLLKNVIHLAAITILDENKIHVLTCKNIAGNVIAVRENIFSLLFQ